MEFVVGGLLYACVVGNDVDGTPAVVEDNEEEYVDVHVDEAVDDEFIDKCGERFGIQLCSIATSMTDSWSNNSINC